MQYQGQIQDGHMHGQGALVYPNSEKYEGQWRMGKRHGKGTYYYTDGGSYSGDWLDDRIQGKGTFTLFLTISLPHQANHPRNISWDERANMYNERNKL